MVRGIKDIALEEEDPEYLHKLLEQDEETIKNSPYLNNPVWTEYAKKNANFLMLKSEYPHYMDDLDMKKKELASQISLNNKAAFYEKQKVNLVPWSILAIPSKAWAKEVFPNDEDEAFIQIFVISDNEYLDYLKELGFKEVPAKKMGDTVQAKFLYAIDLKDNLEDVLKDMDSKTRQMIRKNEKFGIVTRIGTKEDIALFADIMNDTSNRRHFQDRGLTFYEDMYDALCKENHIAFVFAEMDIDLALQKIEEERTSIDKACIERERKRQKGLCNEEKVKMKEKEEKEALERLAKREDELTSLSQKYGKRITLGGILYVFYGNEVASVFGGCYEALKEYQPFYTIHYEMIQYAINHHYERYNFYAIQNHINKDDPQYGIYMFKRGFGGHVIELLGEFILPVNKPVYHLMNFFHKIKSR